MYKGAIRGRQIGNPGYNLGTMYENGEGVLQDYGEAVQLYRLAGHQGLAHAQKALGIMYAQGRGVPQDYAEAVRWYRLAAMQGFAAAQYNLGAMYASGGVSRKTMCIERPGRMTRSGKM